MAKNGLKSHGKKKNNFCSCHPAAGWAESTMSIVVAVDTSMIMSKRPVGARADGFSTVGIGCRFVTACYILQNMEYIQEYTTKCVILEPKQYIIQCGICQTVADFEIVVSIRVDA